MNDNLCPSKWIYRGKYDKVSFWIFEKETTPEFSVRCSKTLNADGKHEGKHGGTVPGLSGNAQITWE